MSKIHEMSSKVIPPEYDIFAIPRTQEAVERFAYTEHRPIAPLGASNQIEIPFTTADDEYVHPRDILFCVKLRMDLSSSNPDKSPVKVDSWDEVYPEQNLLQSFIKQVQMEINNKQILPSNDNYAIRSYLETYVGISPEGRYSFCSAAAWLEEEDRKLLFKPDLSSAKMGIGKEVVLIGRLHIDPSFTGRALIGNLAVKITIHRNDPQFYLHKIKDSPFIPKMVFLEASLLVPRAKVCKKLVTGHRMGLSRSTAKYPLCRVEVKTITLSHNIRSTSIDNVVYGQLPRRVFILMTTNAAYNGNYELNPYEFEHFNLKRLASFVDGQQEPPNDFEPDFRNGLYTREFINLFTSLNQMGTDTTIRLSLKDFEKFPLIVINYAPDRSDGFGMTEHLNRIKRGNLSFQMTFAEPLKETINVLVFCEFDNMFEIDQHGVVTMDYM